MDAEKKLSQFMDAITRSTEQKIEKAQTAAEEKAQQLITDAQSRTKADADRDIANAKEKIAAKYRKRMSQTGYQGKTALLSRRQTLLMSLFADLREKLAAFTVSEDYLPWLKKLLTAKQPEENAVILLREADMQYQDALKQAADAAVTFRADPAIKIGGLSVLSADGRRCENHTLDEAYADQLRNFYRNHKIDGGDK